MDLFSLTNPYELSNEAFVTMSALLLGIPLPHASYLRQHVSEYADHDEWGDFLLNSATHASATRKDTHDRIAREIGHISFEGGAPMITKEKEIPYRDPDSLKRADLMTRSGGLVPSNITYGFTRETRLIMDVTLGHVYTGTHNLKRSRVDTLEQNKRRKYQDYYLTQNLAFAPLVFTTLGEFGPDCLRLLWLLANSAAHRQFGLLPAPDRPVGSSAPENPSESLDLQQYRGRLFHDYKLRMLSLIFECVSERVHGRTFALSLSPAYRAWFSTVRESWQPILQPGNASTLTNSTTSAGPSPHQEFPVIGTERTIPREEAASSSSLQMELASPPLSTDTDSVHVPGIVLESAVRGGAIPAGWSAAAGGGATAWNSPGA
jgi:hypothetical protein